VLQLKNCLFGVNTTIELESSIVVLTTNGQSLSCFTNATELKNNSFEPNRTMNSKWKIFSCATMAIELINNSF
jgi:hypothetical protein